MPTEQELARQRLANKFGTSPEFLNTLVASSDETSRARQTLEGTAPTATPVAPTAQPVTPTTTGTPLLQQTPQKQSIESILTRLSPEARAQAQTIIDRVRVAEKEKSIFKGNAVDVGAEQVSDQTTGVNVPVSKEQPNDAASFIEGINETLKQFGASLTDKTNAEKERDSIIKSLKEDLGESSGQGDRELALREEFGATQENIKALQESNTELAKLKAEFNQLQADFDKQERSIADKPIATPFILGQQKAFRDSANLELKAKAAEIGGKAAIAQALQGNINLARQMAKETTELEFSDIERDIKNQLTLLDVNKDILNDEEQKRAELMKIALNFELEDINQQKEERNSIRDIQIEAARNGATQEQLTAIGNAGSLVEATSIAQGFGVTTVKGEGADIISSLVKQYPDAGISLDDSVETAQNKVKQSPSFKAQLARTQQLSSSGTTGVFSPGFLDQSTEQAVRSDLAEMKLQNQSDEAIKSFIRNKYAPYEITDDALDELLGIEKPEEVAPSPEEAAELLISDRIRKIDPGVIRL